MSSSILEIVCIVQQHGEVGSDTVSVICVRSVLGLDKATRLDLKLAAC